VSVSRRLRRPAPLCAIACALLVPAASHAADPQSHDRYFIAEGFGAPARAPDPYEQYLASYGQPEPLSAHKRTPPSNDSDWPAIALSVAGAVAIAGASSAQFRRVRVRRRRAAHTPA
jgi:hypothetical protein